MDSIYHIERGSQDITLFIAAFLGLKINPNIFKFNIFFYINNLSPNFALINKTVTHFLYI
jgi:hypothetical protein